MRTGQTYIWMICLGWGHSQKKTDSNLLSGSNQSCPLLPIHNLPIVSLICCHLNVSGSISYFPFSPCSFLTFSLLIQFWLTPFCTSVLVYRQVGSLYLCYCSVCEGMSMKLLHTFPVLIQTWWYSCDWHPCVLLKLWNLVDARHALVKLGSTNTKMSKGPKKGVGDVLQAKIKIFLPKSLAKMQMKLNQRSHIKGLLKTSLWLSK